MKVIQHKPGYRGGAASPGEVSKTSLVTWCMVWFRFLYARVFHQTRNKLTGPSSLLHHIFWTTTSCTLGDCECISTPMMQGDGSVEGGDLATPSGTTSRWFWLNVHSIYTREFDGRIAAKLKEL